MVLGHGLSFGTLGDGLRRGFARTAAWGGGQAALGAFFQRPHELRRPQRAPVVRAASD